MTMTAQTAMLAQGAAELDPKDVDMNTKKALALGNALLVCMAVPWALCVIIYTGLHWTYPRDKARAMDLAMEEPSVHPEVDSQSRLPKSINIFSVCCRRRSKSPQLRACRPYILDASNLLACFRFSNYKALFGIKLDFLYSHLSHFG